MFHRYCSGLKFSKMIFYSCVYTLVTSYRSAWPRDVLTKSCFIKVEHEAIAFLFTPLADRVFAALAELSFALQQST